ncbi:MAG: SDR family NAD(P)-dependent oxidoreductase [bacterium]|nr:SDR family NAD(P)-dependent oxidoreductase [bacterium]
MSDMNNIAALVTGAGGGIGRGIARRLARSGARVAAVDVNAESAGETAALIRKAGGEARAITADLSRPEEIERMVAEAVSACGGIDVLVNNAGVGSAAFLESVCDEEIERVFRINLFGMIGITRAAFPHLKKSGRGRVINISSVEGIRGSGLLAVYSASKAAVLGLTRANAMELARYGITVNAICPGAIETEMLAPLISSEESRKKMIKGIPVKRLGTPDDVAAAVAFLASAEASYITAQILVVDGGMTSKTI